MGKKVTGSSRRPRGVGPAGGRFLRSPEPGPMVSPDTLWVLLEWLLVLVSREKIEGVCPFGTADGARQLAEMPFREEFLGDILPLVRYDPEFRVFVGDDGFWLAAGRDWEGMVRLWTHMQLSILVPKMTGGGFEGGR